MMCQKPDREGGRGSASINAPSLTVGLLTRSLSSSFLQPQDLLSPLPIAQIARCVAGINEQGRALSHPTIINLAVVSDDDDTISGGDGLLGQPYSAHRLAFTIELDPAYALKRQDPQPRRKG